MARGARAAHYQNFAVMYLVLIANILEQQDYNAFEMTVDGKSLHTLISFNMRLLEDPKNAIIFVPDSDQALWYIEDDQYFSWMEIYLSRFSHPQMQNFIEDRRPLFNRSAGGYITLYFYTPENSEP